MNARLRFGSRRVSAVAALGMLLALAIAAALLAPEEPSGGGLSSYASGPDGARITYELARRLGWRTLRRERVLDSVAAPPTTQVVIGPQQPLGAHEVHRLLDNVRRGGGLVFSVDGAEEIADSLGMALRTTGRLLIPATRSECRVSRNVRSRAASLPPTVHEIVWRRPPPGAIQPLGAGFALKTASADIAIGVTLGEGRIAAVSSADVFTNDAVRTCEWGADVVVVRALEYVRPDSGSQTMVFDEYHHGYGVHPGSIAAIRAYLSATRSGRLIATLLVAGLLLLLAAAPRPIVPTEPAVIARRSPLEHADALGRAYADVDATRTATVRLVGGLRWRVGRVVPTPPSADDAAFLEAITRRMPSLASRVATVRRGLTESVNRSDFAAIGVALADIERTLLTSPPSRT
jgi:hypothetical protein